LAETALKLSAGLIKKTEKILHLLEARQKENERLKDTVNQLKNRVEELELANTDLENKNKSLKIARAVSGDNEKNLALKLRINELVREIDKCIAQLNR
jgi:hypothetical protein